MFVPEYTITNKTLKNIASIEYSRSIIENTPLLPNFKARVQKEAKIELISALAKLSGVRVENIVIKETVEEISRKSNTYVNNLVKTLNTIEEIATTHELDEEELSLIHKIISENLVPESTLQKYRANKVSNKSLPEEILANLVELFDWYNSLDARDTHPIIVSGIIKAQLELIAPFENFNIASSSLVALLILQTSVFLPAYYYTPDIHIFGLIKHYEQSIYSVLEDADFTKWLEFYTDGLANQASKVEEKVKILGRDSKIAKTTGNTNLTDRQERILEYIQDYGMIQNKDFPLLFPSKSEDSILRDLKKLLDEGIIVKRGKTKSSRYELR